MVPNSRSREEFSVKASLRFVSVAGVLTLALSTAAGAATVRLAPLAGETIATSAKSCPVASAPASVRLAEAAALPAIAAQTGVTGITTVRIALDDRGRVTDESVMGSSGNRWIDQAALRSAQLTRYSAEIRDCQRVAGAYEVIVDFTSVD
jgi:TonB family protein